MTPSKQNIIQWSATETAAAIRSGQAGAAEVTEAHLRRIEQINPGLNAVVERLADAARARAAALDNTKDKTAALFGVPVTTKINIDQKGCATSNGVPALNTPQNAGDSPVVHNLKSSGAVIIGRTSTPEFSLRWFTSNPIYGITHNPHNRALTPGGSSGAAAAATASGMGCIAHGNDLGGSLRYPAYCCGVATIRPSLGCVPAFNPGAPERPPITQLMSVQGPIARTVADVRLGLDVMRQHSPLDPLRVDAAHPAADDARGLKIGYFPEAYAAADKAVMQALTDAAACLRDAGATLVAAPPPHIDDCAALWGELLFTELRHTLLPLITQHGSDALQRTIEAYMQHFDELTSMADFFRALQRRIQIQRAWLQLFEEVDLMLMPVSLAAPFINEQDFLQPDTIPAILEAQKPMYVINVLGFPAVQVPVNLNNHIPAGVQLVGALHHDYTCLQAAELIEQRNGLSVLPVQPAE